MPVKNYRREEVAVLANGIILRGFISGDFCTIERAEDQTTLEAGTHGEVDAGYMLVPHGTVTLSVMASSQANDVLQSLKNAWDLNSTTFNLSIRDTNAINTLASCRNAMVQKDPNITFGNTRGTREWTILCPDLKMVVSGAAPL